MVEHKALACKSLIKVIDVSKSWTPTIMHILVGAIASQTLFWATNEEVDLYQRGKRSGNVTTLLAIVSPTLTLALKAWIWRVAVYYPPRMLRQLGYNQGAVRIHGVPWNSNALVIEDQFMRRGRLEVLLIWKSLLIFFHTQGEREDLIWTRRFDF